MNTNVDTTPLLSVPFPSSPTSPSGGAVGGFLSRHSSPPSSLSSVTTRKTFLQDVFIILGLIAVQVVNSLYMVLLAPLLMLGLKPLFLITFGTLTTSVFVLPFAVRFERKKWPERLSLKMMVQFLLISLGGVTAFQALMLLGIKKTSPAIASVMPNIAPGIIFIIAACIGYEKINFRCRYSLAKIVGTIMCLGGAIAMSILQSPSDQKPSSFLGDESGEWKVGCLCLLAAVLVVSSSTVLQAATMVDFPAPFTLCVITSLMGAVFTALLQIIVEGKMDVGTPAISLLMVAALVILGGMVSSVCMAFQTWAVKKKGPVLVSMFSPTQTVCSAIFTAIILHQIIKIWSIFGMCFMFCGLYMVLWAKKKEGYILPGRDEERAQSSNNMEQPFLS